MTCSGGSGSGSGELAKLLWLLLSDTGSWDDDTGSWDDDMYGVMGCRWLNECSSSSS